MINKKVLDLHEFAAIRENYRQQGKKVVWTNGCFDILHDGHILSLESAAGLGDILVVGINSDDSVRELKGPDRPAMPEQSRAKVVAGLGCVDHVIIFNGKRCIDELESAQPDIYAQGSDYTLETIDQDERKAVEDAGGKIAFLPLQPSVSTSNVIKKVRRSDPEKIISAAFVIIRDDEGRILLVGNNYGEDIKWGLPGGGHHRYESLEQTAIREAKEEVGLDVRLTRYVGLIERIDETMNLHLCCHKFEAEVVSGELTIDPHEEHVVDAKFCSAEEIAEIPETVLGRKYILDYLRAPEEYPPYILMGQGEE